MLIFDASALLALLSDIDRPDLVRMLARAHNVLVVSPRVDAEIVDDRAAGRRPGARRPPRRRASVAAAARGPEPPAASPRRYPSIPTLT